MLKADQFRGTADVPTAARGLSLLRGQGANMTHHRRPQLLVGISQVRGPVSNRDIAKKAMLVRRSRICSQRCSPRCDAVEE